MFPLAPPLTSYLTIWQASSDSTGGSCNSYVKVIGTQKSNYSLITISRSFQKSVRSALKLFPEKDSPASFHLGEK